MIKEVITTKYKLVCDYCGKEYSNFGETDFDYEEDLFDSAYSNGWKTTINGKYHICDECFSNRKEQKRK